MAKKSKPPFETAQLRAGLSQFFRLPYEGSGTGANRKIGSFKWGVYIFYDYDGEPIYVGQTKEKISGRIGRHLTNQRTDAVAMSVLDPFEVFEIEVYPLPQFDEVKSKHPDYTMARDYLDALEHAIHQRAISKSLFKAILNEKDPPTPRIAIDIPPPLRAKIVSDEVKELRGHSDVRIARRAQIISRLAQTISERDVNIGLRRALVTQAERLKRLSLDRFTELGGVAAVPKGREEDDEEDDRDG